MTTPDPTMADAYVDVARRRLAAVEAPDGGEQGLLFASAGSGGDGSA